MDIISRNITLLRKNGIVVSLFLFQYSLLIPLMRYISTSLLIGVSGIVLLAATIFINRRLIVNLRIALVIAVLSAIMLVKIVYDQSDPKVLLNFLMISVPPAIIFSYKFDADTFIAWGKKLSIINFLLLFMTPFIGRRVAYMRFGYGMLLTVIFVYISMFSIKDERKTLVNKGTQNVFLMIIFIISLVETIIYGSRGALIVVLTFIAIDRLFIHGKNLAKNLTLIIVGFVALINLESILNGLIWLSNRAGVNSYALKKYQYQLIYGLEEASSGRTRIYSTALETIKEYPIFGAKMITYDDGTLYAHNLFLQAGRDLGVLAAVISIIFVIYCVYLLVTKKLDVNKKVVISVFFCVSVIRLMMSSNLWERPEFWALVCIVLNYRTIFGKLEITASV